MTPGTAWASFLCSCHSLSPKSLASFPLMSLVPSDKVLSSVVQRPPWTSALSHDPSHQLESPPSPPPLPPPPPASMVCTSLEFVFIPSVSLSYPHSWTVTDKVLRCGMYREWTVWVCWTWRSRSDNTLRNNDIPKSFLFKHRKMTCHGFEMP